MNTIVYVLMGAAAIVVVNVWAANQDTVRNAAASAYESCVQREYHMTPVQYYEQQNKYPLCGN